MKSASKSQLWMAAVAGLMGMALTSVEAGHDHDKKGGKAGGMVKCYGVNKCAGHGQCGGSHSCAGKGGCSGKGSCSGKSACAGKNSCKGQGWLHMPKASCEGLEGGTMNAPEKPMMKEEKKS